MDDPDAGQAARGKPAALRRAAPALVVAAAIAVACAWATPDGAAPSASGQDEDPARIEGFVNRFHRGQELFGSGKDAEAEAIFRSLIEEQPDAAAVHHALAYISWFRGKPADAIEGFEKAAELAPDDGAIRRDCGLRLTDVGRWRESIPHLESARKLIDPDVETLCALGRSLGELGRAAEAEKVLRQAVELDRDSVDARTLLARQMLATRPLESLELLARVPPNWSDVVGVRAIAYERLDRWKEAADCHARLVEVAADGAAGIAALRDAAEGLVRCGDAPRAVAAATKWAARDRTGELPSLRASACLAVARAGAGDADGVVAAFDGAPPMDTLPAGIRAVLALVRGHALAVAHRTTAAREAFEAAAALKSPFEQVLAGYVLGTSSREDLESAAKGDPTRANDIPWADGLRALLAGDAAASAAAFKRAADLSKPPGEHPGLLVRTASAAAPAPAETR